MSTVVTVRDFRNMQSLSKVITHRAEKTKASAELIRTARRTLVRELLAGRSGAVATAIATSVLSGRSVALFTGKSA